MATKYKPTSGDDTFVLRGTPTTIDAGTGSDTFIINGPSIRGFILDGGTNPEGTDAVVKPFYYSGTSVSTVLSSLDTPNATDSIQFNQTGRFSALQFTHIEQIHLAEGVRAAFSSEQLDAAIASLDAIGFNPGLHFYGVAGGLTESVRVIVDYNDFTFTPAATIVGATPTTYLRGDFQLDDASVGDLFHDVEHRDDFFTNSTTDSYARADGSNNDDFGRGSRGVDNATLRLGNDTYWGGEGNDLLVGGQGADWLNGGAGDDIFTITSFGGLLGAAGKADDGNPEWVSGDTIIGGSGIDTLRITGGAASATTVELTDANCKGLEVVEIGATVGRLNVEDSALQLLHNHYYQDAAGLIIGTGLRTGQIGGNIAVDASAITVKGLKFVGNGDANTFIGTAKNDIFLGNGGNDSLTGGLGKDKFEFGLVHSQVVSGVTTSVQTYQETATALTGIDTITDFTGGQDKILLNDDLFTVFAGVSKIAASNLVQGEAVVASDDNDYLLFDTSNNTLFYDADANGEGAAVAIVTLMGVNTLTTNDFLIN